jgi:hypothetical protein
LPIENLCGIFKARVEMSKPYSRDLEYFQATVEAVGKISALKPWKPDPIHSIPNKICH